MSLIVFFRSFFPFPFLPRTQLVLDKIRLVSRRALFFAHKPPLLRAKTRLLHQLLKSTTHLPLKIASFSLKRQLSETRTQVSRPYHRRVVSPHPRFIV